MADDHHSSQNPTSNASLARWYQPGSETDSRIYDKALQRCKAINEDLNPEPFLQFAQHGHTETRDVPRLPTSQRLQKCWDDQSVLDFIEEKRKALDEAKKSEKPELLQKLKKGLQTMIDITTQLKPTIDMFIPQSPEYSVPYACLWMIVKGFVARKEKVELVFKIITSLSQDIYIWKGYENIFPTDEMKTSLAEFYFHTVDLLWRLGKYCAKNTFGQMLDALFPRAKYDFSLYYERINAAAAKLKTLFEIGHVAEQRGIRLIVDSIASDLRYFTDKLESALLMQTQNHACELINIWHDDIGDIEHEFRLWKAQSFSTDLRDHWSHNGILSCLQNWRELCDKGHNSIFWICSQSNGRQFWMTEFCIDLIEVYRSQGQLITFGFCDRPKRPWTPKQLLRQLIAQLLCQNPNLAASRPAIFNIRSFQLSSTVKSIFQLLHSIIAALSSVVIVIDRLNLCVSDPEDKDLSIVEALAMLVKAYPASLRVIITTGEVVAPRHVVGRRESRRLPISFAMVNTRRMPRRRSGNQVQAPTRQLSISPIATPGSPTENIDVVTERHVLIPYGW